MILLDMIIYTTISQQKNGFGLLWHNSSIVKLFHHLRHTAVFGPTCFNFHSIPLSYI